MKKIILSIDGMTCSACSNGLEKYLNKQNGIYNASVNLVIAEQQGKKLEIDLNYKKQISADRNKIHQVLIIILDNSIKYTEKGDSIIIRTEEKDNKFVLNSIDTGIGISDEGLKYVFDRFYREDKARSRQTGEAA